MFVYTTPRFDKKVRKYNLQSKIDKLRDDLEAAGINAVRTLFDPFPPYWKRAQASVRLIARISRVKDNLVFCLLDILEREDTSYQRFQSDPRRFGTAHLDPLWSADDLLTWIEKYKHLKAETHKLPPLPDEMRSWLGPPRWEDTTTQDFVVYESEEWGKRFQRPEILICGVKYCEVISDIINEKNTDKYNLPAWPGLKLYHRDRYHVLFSTIETIATPARRILFLFAPFNNEPSEAEVNQVVESIEPLYKLLGNKAADVATDLSLDQVTPFATRAYPAYLIADEPSWLIIESEEGANLALSPEEEEILRSISIGESTLPVFINGRAGSGKSTILFYLFADYCYRKWRENLPADPLFLTYSGRLLEVAKDRVYKILSSHHRFLVARLGITEVGGRDAKTSFEDFVLRLSDFFRPFQQFLLALLPVEEGKRFKAENYISFHDFKQLYFGKSLHRVSTTVPKYKRFPQEDPRVPRIGPRWSPELCWHVIRTFIKGYHVGAYMDAQDYQEVPRQERTISEDTFKEIHETIWQQWYRSVTREQGYWDDQDLIRKILELECYAPEYGAIFCDEAQDFTRLELQLVMRLSILSSYDLGSTPIHNLPFAFAGDPFQTLNPTGFRWKNLRAAFYEEIVRTLDPTAKWNLSTNFEKELTYNYRSTPPIVRATNLILLWRRVLFDDQDLRPQMCWAKGDFPEPQTFIFGENISADEFKKVKDTIIIVPCEKGQEVSYVQQDPILSQIFPNPDKENPPKNILSPIEAKGLEFKRVIVYKFGEKIDPAVWELVRNPKEQPVEFEYFFNKLYVATTRAMRRLFIVDSKKGDQQLWKYASDPTQFEPFLDRTNNPAMWKEHSGLIARGTSSSVSEMHEDEPLSSAQEFKIKGLGEADTGLLRRARQYYSELGYAEEAKLCEAWALKFEGKFEKAGNLFLEINKGDDAWECFWQGPCWPELTRYDKRWSKKNAEQSRDLAVFMIASAKETNTIKNFTEFLEKSIGSGRLGHPFSKQWRPVIWEYVRRLSGLSKSNLEQTEWQKSGKILKQLDEAQYDNMLEQAGFCFYHAQDFEGAVDCWKEHAQADRNILSKKEYYLAKAEAVGLPEGLEWLDKARTYKKIIKEWEKAGGMKVVDARWLQFVPPALQRLGKAEADETIIKQWEKAGGLEKQIKAQWLELVAGALERKKRHIDAFRLYMRLKDKPDLVLECFQKANLVKAGVTTLEKWEDVVLNYLIRHKYWPQAVDVTNNGVLGGHDPKRARLLRRNVVRELAYSDLTPKEISPDHRRRYQRFIERASSERRSLEEVSEIGAALERVGDLDNTLSFYQGFLDSNDTALSRCARERWIANRRKQENEVRNQPGERQRADLIEGEIKDKLHVWGIPPGTVFSEYASLGPHIQGLPVGAKVEETEVGGRKFQVRQITVETNRDGSLISIFDRKTFNTLKIDLVQGNVTGTEEVNVRRVAKDAHLSFEVPGRYSGKAVYTVGERQVELSIEECTIFIQF